MASHWKSRRKDPEYLEIHKEDVGRRGRFQGGLGSGPWALEWIQEDSGTIPGNSQQGFWYYQFPRKWLEGPRGLVFSPGGIIVVLEAQFHTRAVGTDVVHDDNGS